MACTWRPETQLEGVVTKTPNSWRNHELTWHGAAASAPVRSRPAPHLHLRPVASDIGTFAGVPAPSPPRRVHIKDLDFYLLDLANGSIVKNFCMVDVLDVLRQGGIRPLRRTTYVHAASRPRNSSLPVAGRRHLTASHWRTGR